MNPRWLILSVALIPGCSQAPPADVPYEPPIKTDTNFTNLVQVLAAIPKSGPIVLYRGLPSEFWEPELRSQELARNHTVKLHGYAFYEKAIPVKTTDAERLTALFSSRRSFRRYVGRKRCSGYSPEYGIEWKAGEAATRALVCLECAEVKLFATGRELYCDLSAEARQELEPLLVPYREGPAPTVAAR